MISLAIDTSSQLLSVAVCDADRNLSVEFEEKAGQSHGERLAKVCDDVLLQIGISYQQIGLIVLGSGPGSFTGLRIGYAFAKGLASSLKIPIASRPSFHAFHRSKPDCPYVIGDARSKLYFFSARYDEPKLIAEDDLQKILQSAGIKEIITLDPLPAIPSEVQRIEPTSVARQLLELSAAIPFGEYSVSQLSEITPLYLRSAAAKTIAERSR